MEHMDTDPLASTPGDERLFDTLVRLLAIAAPELRPALDQACNLVAESLGAEKVDAFLYQPESTSLVALGTSTTPMGQRQHALGLNRLPLANGGRAVAVYLAGEPYLQRRTDQDLEEVKGIVEGLGVRSGLLVPLEVAGQRCGVLSVVSSEPDRFAARDLQFLVAVAGWVGLVIQRAQLAERLATQAEQRGTRQAGDELAKLTRRQQEIASCVAEGLTNEEIAERLVLVPGTVANHLEQILARLGLKNRTQLAVWAVEHGLYRSDRNEEAR